MSACFFFHQSGSEKKQDDMGEGTERRPKEGGRARVKARGVPNAVGFSLARNRRSPKRPSEPRPSGVQPEGDEVESKTAHPTLKSYWAERLRCLLDENNSVVGSFVSARS